MLDPKSSVTLWMEVQTIPGHKQTSCAALDVSLRNLTLNFFKNLPLRNTFFSRYLGKRQTREPTLPLCAIGISGNEKVNGQKVQNKW